MILGRVQRVPGRVLRRALLCLLGVAALLWVIFLSPGQAQEAAGGGGQGPLALEQKRIVSILQERLAELEKREQAVRTREKELKVLRADVEDKLEQMQKVRRNLQQKVERQRRLQEEKVKELSGIYENMNAARAAQAMLSMDRELAIGILSNMRRKLAGEVLDQMPGEEAAEISRDYSKMGGGRPPP